MTDLLRLPATDGDRVAHDRRAGRDDPRPSARAVDPRSRPARPPPQRDPAFRARLEAALTDYTGTRAAAAEITTGLDHARHRGRRLPAGDPGRHRARPGARRHRSPRARPIAVLPARRHRRRHLVRRLPGAGLAVPRRRRHRRRARRRGASPPPSPAWSPIRCRRALGLHHRRLTALIDGLERAFTARRRPRLRRLRPLRRPADGPVRPAARRHPDASGPADAQAGRRPPSSAAPDRRRHAASSRGGGSSVRHARQRRSASGCRRRVCGEPPTSAPRPAPPPAARRRPRRPC